MLRSSLLATILIAVSTGPSVAQAGGACPVAGSYSVVGRVPGVDGSYKGEATITGQGNGCYMRWYPPNDSEGTGAYANGVLTIAFTFANGGGSGIVRYNLAPNGELHGVWWMNGNPSAQGTETLRRH